MSESISRAELVRTLSESGLVAMDDLRDALDGLGAGPDGGAVAEHLVRNGQLTRFQAEALLQRRHGELFLGNYVVLDRLGAGGMGAVFKARHRRMKRVVALKLLTLAAARQNSFGQRFQREVETIAQLSHPNIVMAFDADETETCLFLVMEYVHGLDLRSAVEQRGPFSVAEALDCVVQAARGLAYAHGQGIIHRDVKPANLLRDAAGLVKVADLGLARFNTPETTARNSALTQAGGIVGTADFMAPEQALDSTAIDHRADIYALGCTCYFLLTGRPPYVANSLMGLLLKQRDAAVPALRAARPDAPAALEEVFQRMLAKSPDDRYPTMDRVVQVLEEAQREVPSHERPALLTPPAARPSSLSDVTMVTGSAEFLPSSSGFHLSDSSSASAATPTLSDVRRVIDLAVVLVEPSRAQSSIVRKYLRELGTENVRGTGSGREALEWARQGGAGVLLSAMHLSDMTGVQLAQAVRDDPACSEIGFVLASSASDSGAACALLDWPRIVVLSKPFDLRQLARSLARATGRAPEEIMPASL